MFFFDESQGGLGHSGAPFLKAYIFANTGSAASPEGFGSRDRAKIFGPEFGSQTFKP